MSRSPENTVYIGLGSNKGDRLKYLQAAIEKISADGIRIISVSRVYETLPFGIKEQDNFFNAVMKANTDLDVEELFNTIKKIEKDLGRTFVQKWGTREIDIDLLLYNDLIFSNDFISLPHKGLIYRDFVLQPLLDLEPALIHPESGQKLSVLLSELKEKFIIKIISEKLFIPGQIH